MRRLKTVVFCVTVEQARKVACILKETHGIQAEWVCGDKSMCPDSERQRILRGFADGSVECVANVGVLTTGWDCPSLEHIVLARPTKSLSLFTQIFGRGTRPLPGVVDYPNSFAAERKERIAKSQKPHFKFTDLRDNANRHKLVTPVDVLAGEMGLDDEVARIAKELLDKAEDARSLQEVIQESIELKKAKEEEDRRRLAQYKADAKYRKQDVDVFGGGSVDVARPKEKGPRMLFGKHKGKLIREVPTGYLEWALREGVLRAPWLRAAAEKEVASRLITQRGA